MKGIFHPDMWNDWDTPLPNELEIKKLDPEEDKCYLEYIIQHAYGSRQNMLMKKLGFSELPERRMNPENPEEPPVSPRVILGDPRADDSAEASPCSSPVGSASAGMFIPLKTIIMHSSRVRKRFAMRFINANLLY